MTFLRKFVSWFYLISVFVVILFSIYFFIFNEEKIDDTYDRYYSELSFTGLVLEKKFQKENRGAFFLRIAVENDTIDLVNHYNNFFIDKMVNIGDSISKDFGSMELSVHKNDTIFNSAFFVPNYSIRN